MQIKYAEICTKYVQICKNMQWPHKYFSYSFICIYEYVSVKCKYALPTLLMVPLRGAMTPAVAQRGLPRVLLCSHGRTGWSQDVWMKKSVSNYYFIYYGLIHSFYTVFNTEQWLRELFQRIVTVWRDWLWEAKFSKI